MRRLHKHMMKSFSIMMSFLLIFSMLVPTVQAGGVEDEEGSNYIEEKIVDIESPDSDVPESELLGKEPTTDKVTEVNKHAIDLSIDGIDSSILTNTSVNVTDKQTALDALKQALNAAEISYIIEGSSIQAITEEVASSLGGMDGWLYTVNGETPQVGADVYELKAGDALRFYYSRWAEMSSDEVIAGGTENSSISVTLVGDTYSKRVTEKANWLLEANTTGLEIGSISKETNQKVTITFKGKAKAGTLSMTALAEALDGNEASEEVLIEVSEDDLVGEKSVDKMIEDTVQYYRLKSTNLSSWWAIVALWGAGENLTDGSWTLPGWQTKDPNLKPNTGDTEHIRYIFGLLAMGKDPSKAWETNRNLYAELAAQQNENGNIGGINKHVWAMLALDAGERLGHDVGNWNASKKQQALNYVLNAQKSDGGFALFGTESDTDITGMVLLALGNYQDESAVNTAIERAKGYLKSRQLDLENGGFNSAGRFGMGDNSNSLSTSVSGLVAVGEDTLTEKWTVNGKTVVDAYKGFQLENGGFKWKETDKNVNGMATEQALIALTDIQKGKSVWQRIAEQNSTEPNPEPNPTPGENTEPNPNPVPTTKTVQFSVEKRTMGQGDIIAPMQATLQDGDTAYTLLQRIADEQGIAVDASGSGPTIYVKAIDRLGEFDGGPFSGWMYTVNGEFPQFSAGIYTLEEGDSLRWQYTTNLGEDLGDSWKPDENQETVVQPDQPFILPVKPNEDVSVPVVLDFQKIINNKLPSITADRAGVKLEIPSNTSVTGSWDKKIQAPTKRETTTEDKVKIAKALAGKQLISIDAHIKVGASQTITFDQHVSLTFENLGKKEVGFIDASGNFTLINKKASSGSQDDVYAYQDGNDLVIQTKHFTEFVVYETAVKPTTDLTAVVRSAIKGVSEKLVRDGVRTEWEAIGLAKAGVQVPASYVDQFKQNLEDQVMKQTGKGRMKITDVERLTIAASAVGIDPKNVDGKGFNLVEKIYNSEARIMGTESVDSLTFQGNNGIIFALIALDSKAFETPGNAKWTRDKLVAELINNQKSDGSWSLAASTTSATSIDITAMALTALSTYQDKSNAKKAIDDAVAFLAKTQGLTGGFNEAFVGGITSEATSQVIIALTANGIDPRSEQFTKNGINVLDHLLSFKAEDGGFKHIATDTKSNGMATEQALQALVAFDLYVTGKGPLYQFSGGGSTEPNPNPEPDPKPDPKPEEKPDPTPTSKTVHLSVEKRTMGQGDIISPMQATLLEGDTAYTLLQRVADNQGVSISVIGSGPTIYVQAIDGLGEFDGGPLSGWMYSVNGEFPQFSAGIYTLKEGDVLRWQYTKDLGKDLGNSWSPGEDEKPLTTPELTDVSVPAGKAFILAVKPNEDVSIPVVMEFTTTVLPNVIAKRAGVKLEIASNTSVSSDWDKKIQAPTKKKTTKEDTAKITKALAGKQLIGIDAHIKVGGSKTITFSQYVSLTFENFGDKEAGFIDVNGNFKLINKKGSLNSQNDVYAYKDGKDLVIKTKHFTEFIVFETTEKPSNEVLGTIQSAIKGVSNKLLRDGVQTEWEAIGLAKAGVQVPASYVTQFKKNLNEQVISKSGTGRMKITDIERLTMAATAIGINPENVDGKGFNLIEKIYNSEDRKMATESVDSLTFQGNNGIIFALIALDAKAYEVPNRAKWTRDKLVAELVKYQKSDGSWSLETSTTGSTSIDITAMALTSLAQYRDKPNAKTAIDKAVAFLAKEQGRTGGFNEAFVGGITSEATSQVIIALTANGIDPGSDKFTKNGINLVDHLLSFKAGDGGFKHIAEDQTSNSMATEQALQALVAVELYVKGEGALYQFTAQKPESIQFTDISSHWAKGYIDKAIQAGLVNGYEDGTFRPNNQLTRAQAVSIIVRALELETTDKVPFKDIENYAKETRMEIAAAYKYGIVKGNNGEFNPSQKVTRAQMALMMQRALAYKFGEKYVVSNKAPFTDFGHYNKEAVDAISMLYDTGIVTGDNGKYMPGTPTSRAHATKMLVNFIELQQAN